MAEPNAQHSPANCTLVQGMPLTQLLTNRPHIPSGKANIILEMSCGDGPQLLSPTTPEEGGCPLLLLLLTTNSLMDRQTDP